MRKQSVPDEVFGYCVGVKPSLMQLVMQACADTLGQPSVGIQPRACVVGVAI